MDDPGMLVALMLVGGVGYISGGLTALVLVAAKFETRRRR